MEEFKKQEVDFMEFVYSKAGEFTNKHLDFFETVFCIFDDFEIQTI